MPFWAFVGGKDKKLSDEKKEAGLGSVWTWTCLDADTKLVPSWLVGSRDTGTEYEFMNRRCRPHAEPRAAHHGRAQAVSDWPSKAPSARTSTTRR
jgi:hypothetical protein